MKKSFAFLILLLAFAASSLAQLRVPKKHTMDTLYVQVDFAKTLDEDYRQLVDLGIYEGINKFNAVDRDFYAKRVYDKRDNSMTIEVLALDMASTGAQVLAGIATVAITAVFVVAVIVSPSSIVLIRTYGARNPTVSFAWLSDDLKRKPDQKPINARYGGVSSPFSSFEKDVERLRGSSTLRTWRLLKKIERQTREKK